MIPSYAYVPTDPVRKPVAPQFGTLVNTTLQALWSSKNFEKNYRACGPLCSLNEHGPKGHFPLVKVKPPPKSNTNIIAWKPAFSLAPRAQDSNDHPPAYLSPPTYLPSKDVFFLTAPTLRTSASSFASAKGHPGWEISTDSAGELPGAGVPRGSGSCTLHSPQGTSCCWHGWDEKKKKKRIAGDPEVGNKIRTSCLLLKDQYLLSPYCVCQDLWEGGWEGRVVSGQPGLDGWHSHPLSPEWG